MNRHRRSFHQGSRNQHPPIPLRHNCTFVLPVPFHFPFAVDVHLLIYIHLYCCPHICCTLLLLLLLHLYFTFYFHVYFYFTWFHSLCHVTWCASNINSRMAVLLSMITIPSQMFVRFCRDTWGDSNTTFQDCDNAQQ